MRIVAMILAGGEGARLSVLSEKRAKPSVPFAGKFRIIDFPLSNCVNSGIFDAAVLTQYRPHSLNAHIGNGKPWDLDRSQGGVQLLQPYTGPPRRELVQGHRRRESTRTSTISASAAPTWWCCFRATISTRWTTAPWSISTSASAPT